MARHELLRQQAALALGAGIRGGTVYNALMQDLSDSGLLDMNLDNGRF